MKSVWASLCLLPLIALQGRSQDFDKTKHIWTKWQVGASVRYKVTIETDRDSQEGKYTQALTALTDKSFTYRQTWEVGGKQEHDETEEFPIKDGEETLKVAGKEFKCVIFKSQGKSGDTKTESRAWIAAGIDVPLKIVVKTAGKDHIELEAVAVGEKIAIDGKEFECVKLTGVIDDVGGKKKFTDWMTADVPGGVVKSILVNEANGTRMSFHAVEIVPKK